MTDKSKIKIYVLENNNYNYLDGIMKGSIDAGYGDITSFEDKEQMLEHVNSSKPNVVMMNAGGYAMDNFDSIKALHGKDIALIINTNNKEEVQQELKNKGMKGIVVIKKSFSPKDIGGVIEKALAKVVEQKEKPKTDNSFFNVNPLKVFLKTLVGK